jgi:hypothetical protein
MDLHFYRTIISYCYFCIIIYFYRTLHTHTHIQYTLNSLLTSKFPTVCNYWLKIMYAITRYIQRIFHNQRRLKLYSVYGKMI